MNKGYQEDMILECLSASNPSFCIFILKSFKLYFHFSKKHWKSYFIVMLKKPPFMKRRIVQGQKAWSCYLERQGNLEQWSGVSVLTSRDIKPNHLLAFVSLLPLFCQWSKMLCFTSTNTDLLIHLCLLAVSQWRHFFVGYVAERLHCCNRTSCKYNNDLSSLVVKISDLLSSAQTHREFPSGYLGSLKVYLLTLKVMPGFN